MKIGQIAKETGLSTSAIRYYEDVGLIDEPPRVSNQRSFSGEVVSRLQFIKQAARLNFSIREIKTFLDGLAENEPHSSNWQGFATRKIGELESQILDLQDVLGTLRQSLSCGCEDPTACRLRSTTTTRP